MDKCYKIITFLILLSLLLSGCNFTESVASSKQGDKGKIEQKKETKIKNMKIQPKHYSTESDFAGSEFCMINSEKWKLRPGVQLRMTFKNDTNHSFRVLVWDKKEKGVIRMTVDKHSTKSAESNEKDLRDGRYGIYIGNESSYPAKGHFKLESFSEE